MVLKDRSLAETLTHRSSPPVGDSDSPLLLLLGLPSLVAPPPVVAGTAGPALPLSLQRPPEAPPFPLSRFFFFFRRFDEPDVEELAACGT